MRKYLTFISAFLLSIMLAASASAFSISSDIDGRSVCIGSTAVLTTLLSGSGSFTTSQEGSASAFTMTVPQSFSAEDGQNIYSYITPSSKTKPGDYDLNVKVSDGSDTKGKSYSITVKDCPKTEFTVESKKFACPCQKTEFMINIRNNADYAENFTLAAEGTLAEYINLTDRAFSLESNSEKNITASVDSPCNINGQYDIVFRLKPKKYFSSLAAKSVLDIQPCYEYSLSFKNPEYSMCENDYLSIPLKLSNQGTANNSFAINLDGPKWASSESHANMSAGEERTLNFTLNPPYGTTGNFTITVDALSEYGNVNKKAELRANVEKCYDLSAYFKSKKETICDANREYDYPLTIRNAGRFDESLNLSIDAPDWASLGSNQVMVKSNESVDINITIKFPSSIVAKEYPIKIKATDGLTTSEDTLTVKAASTDECYSPSLSLENSSIEVALENSQIVPIDLKNNGIEETTFIISLDGDASSFSMVNPSMITLKAGKSETLYIHVSPQIFADVKEYSLTVEARVKDSKIVSAEKLNINVVQEQTGESESNVQNETPKEESGFFAKIVAFFMKLGENAKSIFSFKAENQTNVENKTSETNVSLETKIAAVENDTIENETMSNVTESEEASNVTESTNVTDVNVTLTENVTVENATETAVNATLTENATVANETIMVINESIVDGAASNVTNEGFSFSRFFAKLFNIEKPNATSNVTISSENQTLDIVNETMIFNETNVSVSNEVNMTEDLNNTEEINKTENVEVDKNGLLNVTDNSSSKEIVDITENANEENAANLTTNMTWDNAKKSMLDFSAYKSYIIGALSLIVIIIIFATGFWRKIINFFDDEEQKK